VHGAAFAPAIPFRFAEQFTKHGFQLSAFGDAMAMTTVRAGDVVAAFQVFAETNRHRLLAAVHVG